MSNKDVEDFKEFSDGVKRGLVDGIKEDKAGYTLLVERVRSFNKEAAVYMHFQAPTLVGFQYNSKLMHAFDWSSTPQGVDYWTQVFDDLFLADPIADIDDE